MQATVFVHPGYLRRTDVDGVPGFSQAHRTTPGYGSYSLYIDNLLRLNSARNGRRIFLLEESGGQIHSYSDGFEPLNGDVVFDWKQGPMFDGWLYVMRRKSGGWEKALPIKQDALPEFLEKEGFDSYALAGEMGPYSTSHLGCVGAIHDVLSASPVMGIKGCIFPLVPQKIFFDDMTRIIYEFFMAQKHGGPFRFNLRRYAQLFQDLYDNAVDIPSSSGSAEPAGLSVGS